MAATRLIAMHVNKGWSAAQCLSDRTGLEKLAFEAVNQINGKRYDAEMRENGIAEILKPGIAFFGKELCIRAE